jgi:hypothetical protein
MCSPLNEHYAPPGLKTLSLCRRLSYKHMAAPRPGLWQRTLGHDSSSAAISPIASCGKGRLQAQTNGGGFSKTQARSY